MMFSLKQIMLHRRSRDLMILNLTCCLPVDLRNQILGLRLKLCHQSLIAACAFVQLSTCQAVKFVQVLFKLIQS